MSRTSTVLLIVVAILFCGFWAWQYHSRTPEAAIDELMAAIAKGNTVEVAELVDLEEVLRTSGLEGLDDPSDDAVRDAVDVLIDAIAARDPARVDSHILIGDILSSTVPAEYAGVLSTEQDAGLSRLWIGLRYPDLDSLARVRLRLERNDGQWRVTRIENLGGFLEDLREARTGSAIPSD